MIITAIIDRIENGQAILLSNETGMEISIPVNLIKGAYSEGEILTLTIDNDGNVDNI